MVRGLNKAQLIGSLGRDPELRYTAAGAAVANVTVAVNRLRRGPDGSTVAQTEWFRVVLWDTLAETAVDHLCKGNAVFVEGRLQSRTYTDKEGAERTVVEVVAGELIMLGGHNTEEIVQAGAGPRHDGAPAQREQAADPAGGGRETQRPARPQGRQGAEGSDWDTEGDEVPF